MSEQANSKGIAAITIPVPVIDTALEVVVAIRLELGDLADDYRDLLSEFEENGSLSHVSLNYALHALISVSSLFRSLSEKYPILEALPFELQPGCALSALRIIADCLTLLLANSTPEELLLSQQGLTELLQEPGLNAFMQASIDFARDHQ